MRDSTRSGCSFTELISSLRTFLFCWTLRAVELLSMVTIESVVLTLSFLSFRRCLAQQQMRNIRAAIAPITLSIVLLDNEILEESLLVSNRMQYPS